MQVDLEKGTSAFAARDPQPQVLESNFLAKLSCPVDRRELVLSGQDLACEKGHQFPVVQGVPILLHPEVRPEIDTIPIRRPDLERLADKGWIDLELALLSGKRVDPYVQRAVGATNGNMYLGLQLEQYPLPEIRIEKKKGGLFLDIGCNWGRWCLSAQGKGYEVYGLDPNPEAVFAAVRVARQMGVKARYVVGDARYLPFRDNVFETIYSYSVLQHFAPEDVRTTVREMSRVLSDSGSVLIQMANAWGARNIFQQLKRGFHSGRRFNVRYWRLGNLKRVWEQGIGESQLSVDGFFSLNPQAKESHLLPRHFQWVVKVSDWLKDKAENYPFLIYFADSVYILSQKGPSEA